MNDSLASAEMWFEFYVQHHVDHRTPIEDSTVEWTESVSKLEHVAKIVIPSQDIMSAGQDHFCENLSFSPWHCLPEHKPLGLVNRVRKRTYLTISEYRHNLNQVAPLEPRGDETFEQELQDCIADISDGASKSSKRPSVAGAEAADRLRRSEAFVSGTLAREQTGQRRRSQKPASKSL